MSQRTPAEGQAGAEQPVLRTVAGSLDFEEYYKRAHVARSEASRQIFAALVALGRHICRLADKPVIAADRKPAWP